MTKKHFERIARIIKLTRISGLPAEKEAARRMMYVFRDEFARDFPRFDGDKFITASGGHILTDEDRARADELMEGEFWDQPEEPNLCYRCKRETAVPESIGPCYECQTELHATGDYDMDGDDDLPF